VGSCKAGLRDHSVMHDDHNVVLDEHMRGAGTWWARAGQG